MKMIKISLILLLLFVTGCDEKDYKDDLIKLDDINNVEISYNKNEQVVLFITNNNDYLVDIEYTVSYLDSNENIIEEYSDSIMAVNNNEIIEGIHNSVEYSDVRVEVSVKESDIENNYTDDLKIDVVDSDKTLLITVTNENRKSIDSANIEVIFIKDEKIVGADYAKFSIESYSVYDTYVFKPSLDYDRYEIFITEAY